MYKLFVLLTSLFILSCATTGGNSTQREPMAQLLVENYSVHDVYVYFNGFKLGRLGSQTSAVFNIKDGFGGKLFSNSIVGVVKTIGGDRRNPFNSLPSDFASHRCWRLTLTYNRLYWDVQDKLFPIHCNFIPGNKVYHKAEVV